MKFLSFCFTKPYSTIQRSIPQAFDERDVTFHNTFPLSANSLHNCASKGLSYHTKTIHEILLEPNNNDQCYFTMITFHMASFEIYKHGNLAEKSLCPHFG